MPTYKVMSVVMSVKCVCMTVSVGSLTTTTTAKCTLHTMITSTPMLIHINCTTMFCCSENDGSKSALLLFVCTVYNVVVLEYRYTIDLDMM